MRARRDLQRLRVLDYIAGCLSTLQSTPSQRRAADNKPYNHYLQHEPLGLL